MEALIFVLSGVSQLRIVTSEGGFGVSLFGLHADSGLMQTATDSAAKRLYHSSVNGSRETRPMLPSQ